MRLTPLVASLVSALAFVAACDEPKPQTTTAPSAATVAITAPASATAAIAPTAAPQPAASATTAPTAGKGIKAPRPVPLGSSGPIQPSAPPEQQMMAIQYTLAMLAPQPTDPSVVDKDAVAAMVKKIEGVVRAADKGKTPANPVKSSKGDRKIEVEMGKGCNERTPQNLLEQRAGITLRAAYDAGVLVVTCHDDKWECHQSTRDPIDVLCVAAPR